jgi:hypothetical protein
MGDNRHYLLDHVPDFASMTTDARTLTERAEVIIVTQNTPAYRDIVAKRRDTQIVVDLVHLPGQAPGPGYHVLC